MPESVFQRSRTLFGVFFYLSTFILGGGVAMLPMMKDAFVDKRHWMTDEQMVDTVAAMQSLPGLIAANMSVLIGYRIAGVLGAIAALAGAVLPPFIAIVALAAIVARLRQYPVVEHLFLGVRSAVAALILLAVLTLARQILTGTPAQKWFAGVLMAVSFAALVFCGVPALWLVVFGALLGLLCCVPPRKSAQ